MSEVLLVVTLDKTEDKAEDQSRPVAIWPEEAWDNVAMDDEGIWANKVAGYNHTQELTEEEFEKRYGWPIGLVLKPGTKCVIRSETKWEPVEEKSDGKEEGWEVPGSDG